MQIERAVVNITTLGPNNRLAFFVNGCYFNCKGCVSKRLQVQNTENECDIEEYFSKFDFTHIQGITVSGGEPFLQVAELKKCVNYFLAKGIDDILVYTGFTIKELLEKNDEDIRYILKNIAVIIDGRYEESLNDGTNNLKGSTNQNIIILNDKYYSLYKQYEKKDRLVEKFFLGNIELAIGIPTKEFIENF